MFRLPAPFVTNLYISWLTLLPPRRSLSGLLRCCLPGSKFFTFSSNKITLCFQAVTNFLVNSFGQLIKGTRADSSPLPELFEKLEPWYQQRHTCPHPLLQELRTHLSKSLLVLRSPVLKLKVLNFYLVGYSRYCPFSVERYCEVGGVERHWNIPTPWTEILNGTWLKDIEEYLPNWKTVRGAGWKVPRKYHTVEGTGERGSVRSYRGIPAAQSKDTEVLHCRMYGAHTWKYLVNWRS